MTEVIEGSGNVFQDLGFEYPQEEMAKAELVRQIYSIIKKSGLTQIEISKALNLERQDAYNLMQGKCTNLSLERLFSTILFLGKDIDIIVKPHSSIQTSGEIHVVAIS